MIAKLKTHLVNKNWKQSQIRFERLFDSSSWEEKNDWRPNCMTNNWSSFNKIWYCLRIFQFNLWFCALFYWKILSTCVYHTNWRIVMTSHKILIVIFRSCLCNKSNIHVSWNQDFAIRDNISIDSYSLRETFTAFVRTNCHSITNVLIVSFIFWITISSLSFIARQLWFCIWKRKRKTLHLYRKTNTCWAYEEIQQGYKTVCIQGVISWSLNWIQSFRLGFC